MDQPAGNPPKCPARILRKRKMSSVESKDSKIPKLNQSSSSSNSPETSHSQDTITWPSFTADIDKRLIRYNNPLPTLTWADSFSIWKAMIKKEIDPSYSRDAQLFTKNPCVQQRMRAVLLDWLNEVCEVYKMQRKCLYMAIDYVDRYLSRVSGVQKRSLQLIGVAALFIASKSEEIYPPNLSEFSFITDGACSNEDILRQELHILQVLSWRLTPVTPVCWVGLLLQVLCATDDILSINFEQQIFVKICRLIDLSMLNVGSLSFSYFSIAVAAISFFIFDNKILPSIIALSSQHMQCKAWMSACYRILASEADITIPQFSTIPSSAAHNIQAHLISPELLEAVQSVTLPQSFVEVKTALSPPRKNPLCVSSNNITILTPPKSIELKPKSGQSLKGVVDPEVLSVKYIDLSS